MDFPLMWKCWHDLAIEFLLFISSGVLLVLRNIFKMWINFSAIFFIESQRFHANSTNAKRKSRTLHSLSQCQSRGILPWVLSRLILRLCLRSWEKKSYSVPIIGDNRRAPLALLLCSSVCRGISNFLFNYNCRTF